MQKGEFLFWLIFDLFFNGFCFDGPLSFFFFYEKEWKVMFFLEGVSSFGEEEGWFSLFFLMDGKYIFRGLAVRQGNSYSHELVHIKI